VDVIVTLAPTTAAPLVSVTTPVIVPEVICATAAGTNASKEMINAANTKYFKLRMGNPPRGLILLM
jgi:N-acetyl-gamma-glutamylphosphate reductase